MFDFVRVEHYYETHNGYAVVQHTSDMLQWMWIHNFDGIKLSLNVPGITAWKDGQFYDLLDLYNQGILTQKDIIKIGEDKTPKKSEYVVKVHISYE